jgi:outer membrane protein assembly factor BamD (BamD/ComL family)
VASRLLGCGLLLSLCTGCALPGGLPWAPAGTIASARADEPGVGTASWWKRHRSQAVFVPGKGYSVEGVAGYFDELGRRIGEPPVENAVASSGAALAGKPRQASLALPETSEPVPDPSLKDEAETSWSDRLWTAVGQGPDARKAKQMYGEGQSLFRARDYEKAAEKFEEAARRAPESSLQEDSLFMAAESHFFADRYPDAVDAYDELLKKFPGTQRLDQIVNRQFAIARYWQQHHSAYPHWPVTPNFLDQTRHWFDTFGHSLRVYENLRLNDPTGPLADDALMAAATAYFAVGRYDDANYHFDLLRREYPKSEHQFQAHLLGLQCKIRLYQGPEYDGTILDEAEQVAEQLLVQFPDQLAAERDRVLQMRAEIAAQRALRHWTMAEYYAKGSHYRAARYYYQKLIDAHPGTSLAERATERLAEYQDRPESPPQRLAWLVDLFPAADERGSSTRR